MLNQLDYDVVVIRLAAWDDDAPLSDLVKQRLVGNHEAASSRTIVSSGWGILLHKTPPSDASRKRQAHSCIDASKRACEHDKLPSMAPYDWLCSVCSTENGVAERCRNPLCCLPCTKVGVVAGSGRTRRSPVRFSDSQDTALRLRLSSHSTEAKSCHRQTTTPHRDNIEDTLAQTASPASARPLSPESQEMTENQSGSQICAPKYALPPKLAAERYSWLMMHTPL